LSEVQSSRAARLAALRALIEEDQRSALPQVKADINVTPLVDVVLVLLIIFMVVTPLIASGVSVDLPRTVHHSRKPDDGKDIIISVTRDKRIYVGSSAVDNLESLAPAVQAERRKFPEKSLFIKGDARTTYGAVREVMQALHAAQIDEVTLGTEEANAPVNP
jgi:biopolymer transport protein TolR